MQVEIGYPESIWGVSAIVYVYTMWIMEGQNQVKELR